MLSRLLIFTLLACAGALPAIADRVNLAKFQIATSSTQNGDYDPSFATDGIVSNFHSFRTIDSVDPQWVQIRFPRDMKIGSAHVYLGLDNNPAKGLSHLKFQYRNNSGNWVDVPGSERYGNTATELVVPFTTAPTSDRFRLWSDDRSNRIVREIALFSPNLVNGSDQGYSIGTDVSLNLARQRPVIASGNSSGNYPKNAADGYVNNSARWLSPGTSAGDYIEIDLLANHVIGSAHVYSGFNESNAITDFDLRYWNGSAWVVVPGTSIAGNASTARVVTFGSDITTSKIRLRTSTASTARIKELVLFPPHAGGYPLGQDVVMTDPPAANWDDYSDTFWKLRNSGPDLRLALVDGEVRFINNSNPRELTEWQLLLNHRDGTYRIRHAATGLCLSQPQPGSVAGDPVIAETYSALPFQDWKLDFTSGSEFRLINAFSGLSIQSRNGVWADGNPLDLASPTTGALQRWTTGLSSLYPKKGLAGYDYAFNQFNTSWGYSWNRETNLGRPAWNTYLPMQWGNFNFDHGDAQGPLDLIRNDLQSTGKPIHLMGFNEPDQTGQANMTVDKAIELWPRLESMDRPLVAPVPASAFGGWLSSFVSQANALGYRRDYTAVHWYGTPDVDNLISSLQQNYNTFGRPVWLTEFSTVRYSGTATWTNADNYNFLAAFLWRAESLPWLKRYSVFQFVEGGGNAPDPAAAPRSNTRKSGGALTPFGELYATWDGVTAALPNKAYHVHNRGEYERMQNPGGGAEPAFVDPGNSGAGTQWLLAAGITADTYRIISMRDGLALRYVNGGSVGFGSVGQKDGTVEWRLVADQDGWFFLDHPLTSKRLKDNGNGTLGMVSNTNSGDPIKWRFTTPVSPGNAAPPAAPATLATAGQVGGVLLTWSAAAGSTHFVDRSLTPGGPYQRIASGLTTNQWTDNNLPAETTYYYIVTSTNALGLDSAPSAEASATTLHPYATYSGWAAQALAGFSPADRVQTADPERDGHANLLEFAFLTDPAKSEGNAFAIVRSPSGAFSFEFPWNWRAQGSTWKIRGGNDLSNMSAWPVIEPGTVTIVRQGDIDRVRVTPALPVSGRGFYVLGVTEN